MILSKKLKDEVNDISMSEEMKERILQNIIGKEKKKKIKKYSLLKKSLELTAACCTLLVCAQLVKSNPEMFKINDNSNAVKEDSIDYDNDSADDRENPQSSLSESTNDLITELNKCENINQTNSTNIQNSQNEDSKLNIKNDKLNNSTYNSNNYNDYVNKNFGTIENSSTKNNHIDNSNNIINTSDNVNNNSTNINNNNNIDIENNEYNQGGLVHDKNNDNLADEILEGTNNNEGGFSAFEHEDFVCDGSPVSEFKTIEEAEKLLNFKADLIKDIDKKYEVSNIVVISGEILSIDYSDGNKQFTYRESIESGDISGDFNEYDYESTEIIDGNNVCLKGNVENIINLATWRNKEKTYSIFSESGINYVEIIDMINNTKCIQR